MFSHVDALYLPRIAETREHVAQSIGRLLAELDGEAALLGFLLEYGAMRIGPLQRIPIWLRAAANAAAEEGHEAVAEELQLAASREVGHRKLLIVDLVMQREVWYRRVATANLCLGSLVWQASAQQHAALREAAAKDPRGMIATELELADFGRVFGPALVEKCRSLLGSDAEDCMGFVQARAEDACSRAGVRLARLDALLRDDPERAASWAAESSQVIRSYLDALVSCVERRPRPSGASRRWSSEASASIELR